MYKSILILVIAVAIVAAYEPYKQSGGYESKKEATSYQNYNLKNGKPVYVKVPYVAKKEEYKPYEYQKEEYKSKY